MEHAHDTRERFSRDRILGGYRSLPKLCARMRVAPKLSARDIAIAVDAVALRGNAKQDIEHTLGVGLHEAGVAGEHPTHDFAGLLGCELEEHVIGVCDLDEEVRATAGLALLVLARLGLYADAGRVGRDAVCGGKRLLAHRFDDRRTGCGAHLLEPAAHRAAVDRHAEAGEAVFLTMQRQAVAELVARDVRE